MSKKKDEIVETCETETEERLSRRKMLAKGAALAAGAVAAVALPSVAEATDGDNLQVGVMPTSTGANSTGVVHQSSGTGTFMVTPSGIGTLGRGTWVGVMGEALAASSIGVQARNESKGTALHVMGKNVFSRSGRVLFGTGTRTKTITLPSSGPALAWNSWILATLQGSGGTGCTVMYATRTGSYSLQIVLNKATARNVYCAWFILN